MLLQKDDVILFNGDSTTDCGRIRAEEYSLSGYSKIVSQTINMYMPEYGVQVYNRGISGNTSADLVERIEKELVAIKPTILSILIGINDTWRRYDSAKPTTTEQFSKNLTQILTIASKYVRKIILLEPFIIPTNPNINAFYEDLDPKIKVVRDLAAKFSCTLIPLDGIFAEASVASAPILYSQDGIHPTEKGNVLISQNILSRLL